MTPQDWIDKGYERFDRTYNDSDYGLQKLFSDDDGKRYYLTVYVYEHHNKEYFARNQPYLPAYGFAPDVQFSFEDGRATMNVELILNKDSTTESLEEQIKSLWVAVGMPYYERWV